MLTAEKLQIYVKFDGDPDGWVLSSTCNDKSNMADDVWYFINDLIQGMSVVASGLASLAFSQQVESKLQASTADEATRDLLRGLVGRKGQINVA